VTNGLLVRSQRPGDLVCEEVDERHLRIQWFTEA
jgi:hypothetical protein